MSFDFRTKVPPTTRDGRQIVLPSTIGDSEEVTFSCVGDDIVNGNRLVGQDLKTSISSAGDSTVTWQYMEWVDVNGGTVRYTDANDGDYVHYDIYAPATDGTSNEGAGKYDKYNLGGPYNMFVPNDTHTGDWDLDLNELHNSNVSFRKVVPVPANDNGYFDWDADTYAVTLNAAGTGKYNIFDFEIHLTRIVNKNWLIPVSGLVVDEFTVPASYGAKRLLPNYQHKFKCTRVGTGTLKLWWRIFMGRDTTTP